MAKRSPRLRLPPVDHAALFVEATKRAARRAGWLDAYRKGLGLLITANRSQESQERLARAIEEAVMAAASRGIGNDASRAPHQARTQALHCYHGDFWICTLQRAALASLQDGDEYYSAQEVREIVEGISPRRWDV